MAPLAPEACAAFVGLDGADATPDVCLPATGTTRRAFLSFAHRPEAIDAWVQTLRTRFPRTPCRCGPGPHQRASRVGMASIRLPWALSLQSAHRGPVPRSVSPEPGQRRSQRCGTAGCTPPQTPGYAY